MIEVVIVITILGLMAVLAMPKMAGAAERSRLSAGERQIHAAMASAEQRAFRRGETITVTFRPTQNQIHFDAGSEQWVLDLSQPPFEIEIASVSVGPENKYEIAPNTRANAGGIVTLERRGQVRTVTFGPMFTASPVPLNAALSPGFAGELSKSRLAAADGTEPPPRNGDGGAGMGAGAFGAGGM